MAEFNSCASLINKEDYEKAKLEYERELIAGRDPLCVLFSMQKSLQDKLADSLGRIPRIEDIKTKGQLYDWIEDQELALRDEHRELVEAIAGMEKPEKDRSAIWKKWKAKYNELRNEPISSLSDFEQKELKFEIIDALHFYINKLLALGIDPKEMFILYYLKNKENFARQERNY